MARPRTKIHCTAGPACRDTAVLEAMIDAGADVFRVNAALVEEEAIPAWVSRVREAAARVGRHVGLLVDLPGPKFRLAELVSAEIRLEPGQELGMDADASPGDATRLALTAMPFLGDVAPGTHVVLGDGTGRLEVLAANPRGLRLRVLEGAVARPGLGVHFPGAAFATAVPTPRDRRLLRAAVAAGADMVAQSFVRSADDMGRLREELAGLGAPRTLAVAKIERLDAVHALPRILGHADAVIIGRGDLGIDAGAESVPSLQRGIVEAARRASRPVVVATEMLESMVESSRPTRAEASDVAGAVFGGADGVMLSAETARGHDPVRAVRTMAEILVAAEADPGAPYAGGASFPPLPTRANRPDQHVVSSAVALARETRAAAIVVFTREGASAVRLSKERPEAAITAYASRDEVCRRLAIAWGVRPATIAAARGSDEIFQFVRDSLYGPGGLAPGDRAVLVMGSPRDPAGATTLIKLLRG